MEKIAKRHSAAVALSLAATFLLLAAAVPAAARAGETPTACETVSLAFLQKTLGLHHSALTRDHSNLEGTAGEEPSELPHAIHTECGVALWSGKKPASRAATFQKARAGRAAQVGVDTWAPNDESPDVGEWEGQEFDELTGEFLKARFQFVHVSGHAKPLNPQGDGYIGAGLVVKATGLAKGLIAAAGCWWDHSAHRAICLLDEEAEGKPVVDNLNALAKKIVPKFLGAP
jgi:hypothetical protein